MFNPKGGPHENIRTRPQRLLSFLRLLRALSMNVYVHALSKRKTDKKRWDEFGKIHIDAIFSQSRYSQSLLPFRPHLKMPSGGGAKII